jgi:hypothetical protein
MTITGSNFIYAGQSSDEYGVKLCYIGSPNKDTNDEESKLVTTKNIFKETWDFHYLERTNPLQFKITVAKTSCEPFNADEQRYLKKWLCKNKFNWLSIDQDDLYDSYFYVIMTNPRPSNIEAFTYAWDIDCTCDCGHAWSGLNKKNATVNNTLNMALNFSTDFDEYIVRPFITIVPTSVGTVNITNVTTGKSMIIDNCVVGEIIKIDCLNHKQQSSSGRVILDNWNKTYVEFVENMNNLTLSGNFTVSFEYRLPVRIGG